MIIDAQLHSWAPESAEYPWDWSFCGTLPEHIISKLQTQTVAPEWLIELMNQAEVHGALLTSSRVYGCDHRFAFAAAERYPGRFAVVGFISPHAPDVDAIVEKVRDHPFGVGIRLIVYPTEPDLTSELYSSVYDAAEQFGVPLFLTAMERLRSVADVARARPKLTIVLDHLGLTALEPGPDRLRMLPDLLGLAEFDKVAVKCTGAPELSRDHYPFGDLWPPLRRVIDAFGAERVMWGSDFTQHREELSYVQALDYLRLASEVTDTEKEWILGKAAQQVTGWSPY